MSGQDCPLPDFTPIPDGMTLPDRIASEYDAESCLRAREDGGFVLRLRRRADGARFVLKVLPAGAEDLESEYQILTRLAPLLPGAVPEAVDRFREGSTGYLLRSFLPGETLAQYRERVERCPEEVCVHLGQRLCALLETLHSQEPPVIHRDIKPGNIILLPDGGVGLIDFGIARQYRADQDADTRKMGTRATAAPEQYGYAQTDCRTDLYGLGMTLIWLATGRYDREGLEQALSPRLRRVLERAVSFAPERRYQSAAAFSAALGGSRKRHWLPWAAALCALALAAVIALPGSRETAETPPVPPPAAVSVPTSPTPEPVAFTSRSMEAAIRQALGQPDGEITYDQLGGITRLAVVGENAFGPEQVFDYRIGCYIDNQNQSELPWGDVIDEDLALLAHMPNLEELYLCRQELRDVSALAELPLTTLALCENEILDLSPLASLTELETLYLGGNPAVDYSSLAGLARLKTLAVEGSVTSGTLTVDSLAFLDGLALRKLGLGLTAVRDGDWGPLTRQLALEELLLWEPGEAAVDAAASLSSLRSLTIGDYLAPDLTALSGLTGLEVLNIHKGSVERLDGIENLTRLITLSVGFNAVTELAPLAGLERLNYLQLEGLDIADFSPLAELPALGYVVVPQAQGELVKAACPGHTFELRTY